MKGLDMVVQGEGWVRVVVYGELRVVEVIGLGSLP